LRKDYQHLMAKKTLAGRKISPPWQVPLETATRGGELLVRQSTPNNKKKTRKNHEWRKT